MFNDTAASAAIAAANAFLVIEGVVVVAVGGEREGERGGRFGRVSGLVPGDAGVGGGGAVPPVPSLRGQRQLLEQRPPIFPLAVLQPL